MFSSSSSDLFQPLKAMAAVVLLATMSTVPFTVQAAGSCEGTSLDDALALVRDSTNQLFAAANAYDGVLSEDPARARELIDEIITPHVDLKGFSKLVLGKYWRRATPQQQKRFLTHFHALALRSYATVLTANTDIPIEPPLALTDEFGHDDVKSVQWNAFVRKGGLEEGVPALPEVLSCLRDFLLLPMDAASGRGSNPRSWGEGGRWS